MDKIKYTSVDEYISVFPEHLQELLQRIRRIIKEAAPGAEEGISYNMPAYKYHGILVYFACYKNHIGFYPAGAHINNIFKDDLKDYKTSKGTIQFHVDKHIPSQLVKKIVKFRVRENLEKESLKRKTKKKRLTAETNKGIQAFQPKSRADWRKWLLKNHQLGKPVWLIMSRKGNSSGINYEEAIEEALCFGWIDSTANKRDENSFYLYFTQRKPNSNWSKVNKERVNRMIQQGLMTEHGQAFINLAQKNGAWDAITDAENNIIPEDLKAALNKNKTALKNFTGFPPSSKRIILEWIGNAKRPETREQRIIKTVELAAKNERANHYKSKK